MEDNLVAYKIDEFWGFVDTTGKILHTAQFDKIHEKESSFPLIRIEKKGKRGYIDINGKIVVPAIYEGLYRKSADYNMAKSVYFAQKEGELAVMDTFWRKELTPFRYLAEDLPNQGFDVFYLVYLNEKKEARILIRLVDKMFVILNPSTWAEYPLATSLTKYDFSTHSFLFEKGNEVIVMDWEGKIKRTIMGEIGLNDPYSGDFEYKNCFMMKIKVANKTVYHVYNTKGERLLNIDLDSAYFYNDYVVAKKENQMGLFNLEGTQVLPFEYEEIIFTNKKQLFMGAKNSTPFIIDIQNQTISDELQTY